MQNGLSTISVERRLEVIHELDAAGGTLLDYFLLIFLSCVIATFGLVLNSGAVIIGAMLIAPLMPTILRTALSLVRGDVRRLGNSLTILLAGTFLALVLSTLLGNLVSAGGLNFLEILPSEVTGRTQPTLFDLAVALAGGAAGAYALAQPRLSATLPGVAISTALMPPLCVVGIGVSQGSWEISWGALLLFLANLVAIVFAGSIVFAAMGFGPISTIRRGHLVPRALLLPTSLLLIMAVPLGGIMLHIADDAHENSLIHNSLVSWLTNSSSDNQLVSFDKEWQMDHLQIEATVRSTNDISRDQALDVQREIASEISKTVALKLLVVPVTLLDPITPLPQTPSPPPPTPGATGTAIP